MKAIVKKANLLECVKNKHGIYHFRAKNKRTVLLTKGLLMQHAIFIQDISIFRAIITHEMR